MPGCAPENGSGTLFLSAEIKEKQNWPIYISGGEGKEEREGGERERERRGREKGRERGRERRVGGRKEREREGECIMIISTFLVG